MALHKQSTLNIVNAAHAVNKFPTFLRSYELFANLDSITFLMFVKDRRASLHQRVGGRQAWDEALETLNQRET